MIVINKLKWTGMGKFNSEDHYIYYCGQESLRTNGVGGRGKGNTELMAAFCFKLCVSMGHAVVGVQRGHV